MRAGLARHRASGTIASLVFHAAPDPMTQAPALLLEIGCEDLPARYVAPLAAALAKGLGDGLDRRSVAHGTAQTYATPRRIAVIIEAVAQQQPDQTIERKGPALVAAPSLNAAARPPRVRSRRQ